MKNAFATGKDKWASTLKRSAQSKGALGRTSQNKPAKKDDTAQSMLIRGMQGKKR